MPKKDLIISGIYKIKNKINGKNYYGSSKNIKKRWYSHKSSLKNNVSKHHHLQCSYNKYGEDNFEFLIIECVLPWLPNRAKIIEEREQWYLDNTDCLNPAFGYNHNKKANIPSEECDFKNGQNNLGLNNPMYGRSVYSAWLQKYGKEKADAMHDLYCKKQSKLNSGTKNNMFGKTHSTETKEKISKKAMGHSRNKGIPKSKEHKQKLKEANLGKKQSAETKALKSASLKNKPKIKLFCQQCKQEYETSETRKNISKYCSNKCKGKHRRDSKIDNENRICVCGKQFNCNKYEETKYCSTSCSNKYRIKQ